MKRLIIGSVLFTLLLVSVSCAAPEASVPAPIPAPAPMPPGLPVQEEAFKPEALPSSAAEERMIVRSGDMSLVVDDVGEARDEIARLAAKFDGYVVSSWISGEEQDMRGNISIRVPDGKLERMLVELRDLAVRVKSESTYSQDVTEEYVDLQSRLKNAEATESQYLALLEKAEDVEDILQIYERLSWVRSEIEQIKGRMQYLERTSSMSLLSVNLEPAATTGGLVRAGWSAVEALKTGVRGIIIFGQLLVTVAIWLAIFSPVWVAIIGIIYWRHHRKKRA
ncbi:DUF4349 domain-containing protein [Chloroflexota bacterium]